MNGTIALNRIAPIRVPGYERRRLAAIFAPLENPTAIVLFRSKPQMLDVSLTKSDNSRVLNFKSSKSNTPSASRLKNRGIPFSNTFPRGLNNDAEGDII